MYNKYNVKDEPIQSIGPEKKLIATNVPSSAPSLPVEPTTFDSSKTSDLKGWLPLSEAAQHTPYSAEYLSLLARKNKLPSKKVGNVWYTTKAALESYMQRQMLRAQIQNGSIPHGKVEDLHMEPIRSYKSDVEKFFPQVEKTNEETAHVEKALEKVLDKKLFNLFSAPRATQQIVQNVGHQEKRSVDVVRSGSFLKTEKSKIENAAQRPSHFKTVFSSKVLVASALVALIVFSIAPVPFVFSFFDKSVNFIKDSWKDANTVMGFRPGTHANEILLLDKDGNISIMGHIETEGQLRSYVAEGIAPIVVDSTTTVKNLSADSVDGVSSEQFTLAFVTKNGNVTTEDVVLNGDVSIGQTLTVKGATKLLNELEVGSDLKVFGSAEFLQAMEVMGPAYFESLVTMADDLRVKGNLDVKKNISVRGSIEALGAVIGKSGSFGSLSSRGEFTASGDIKLGGGDTEFEIDSENLTVDEDGNAVFGGNVTAVNFGGTGLSVTNSTSTNATSTNLFSTNAVFTNLAVGNQTLNGFIFVNATGTNATTTNFYSQFGNFDNLSADDLTITDLIFTRATGTSATTTNFYSQNISGLVGRINSIIADDVGVGALTAVDAIITRSTTTAATSTNFFANILDALVARITSLVADDITTSDLAATNATTTNATSTNLYATNATIDNINVGSQTIEDLTFTNATGTNATTTNFFSNFISGVIARITTIIADDITTGALTATNSTTSNATSTNLFSTLGRFTNLITSFFSATDAEITNLTTTNATSTNATSTNFFASNINATNATFTNSTTTNLSTTGNIYTSLTAGSVPFIGASGLLTENNSKFFWNNTVGRLGIGTSSPAVSLDIFGTDALRLPVGTSAQRPAGDIGFVRFNLTTHQFEGYGDNGVWMGLGGVIDADQDTYITADTNNIDEDTLRFFTTGVQRMTILPGGNVGIGTTTPWGKLSVTNTGTGPSFVVEDSASPDTTPFIVTADGRVGIGTSNPGTNNLEFADGYSVGGPGGQWRIQDYSNGGVRIFSNSFNSVADIDISGNGGHIYTGNVPAAANSDVFTFNNRSGEIAGGRYLMKIQAGGVTTAGVLSGGIGYFSGGVGIGTTNPSYALDVMGSSSLGNQAIAGYFTATTTTDSVFPRFTFTNATGTSATTTNFFSTNGTFTNTTLTNANITDLIFNRATGTSATTTNFYSDYITSGTQVVTPKIRAASGSLFLARSLDGLAGWNIDSNGHLSPTNAGLYINLGASQYLISGGTGTFDFRDSSFTTATGKLVFGAATSTNFFSTTASSTNLFSTNFNLGTGSIGSATISNSTITDLLFTRATGTSATTTNLYSENATFANLNTSEHSSEDLTTDNLVFINATGTSATTTNFFTSVFRATLATITSLIANDITTGALTATDSTLTNANITNSTTTNATTTNLFSTTASSTNLFSSLLSVGGNALNVIANGNVGIGTTNPGTKLEVVGTGQQLRLRYDDSNYVGIQTTSDASLDFYTNALQRGRFQNGRWMATEYGTSNLPSFTGMSDTNTGLALWNSDILSLMTAGSHRLTIDASGNVGIGTTTPNYKLQLHNNSSAATYQQFTTSNSGSSSSDGFQLGLDSANNVVVGNYEAGRIDFYTNGVSTPDVVIDSAGKLGVGTTNPGALLQIGATTPTTAANGLQFGDDTSANLYRSAGATIRTDGSFIVGTNLTVNGGTTLLSDTSITGTLGVSGATTLSNTLTVTGATQINSTFGATGAATFGSTGSFAGLFSANGGVNTTVITASTASNPGSSVILAQNTNATPAGNLLQLQSGATPTDKFVVDVSGNTTIAGTLGVTGATSLSTLTTSGAATLNSLGVTNNATVGGTLGVTGNTLLSTLSTAGAATLNSLAVTNNATVGGTLGVTGATSLAGLTATGLTLNGAAALNGNTTLGDATSDTITFTGRVSSNILPSVDDTYTLGALSLRWAEIHATNLIADNISVPGTSDNDFIINTDNATADTEDGRLIFERGSVVPNAWLKWNATDDEFEFNQNLVAESNFTVTGTTTLSGAATTSSTLGVVGDFSVNTNKFNVAAATGNTTVGGTLGVTGASNFSSTGSFSGLLSALAGITTNALTVSTSTNPSGSIVLVQNTNASPTGNLLELESGASPTDKFVVTAAGNTTIAGTLGVTGATSLSTLTTSGAATLNSLGVTNNATVGGTLGVTGATTLSSTFTVNGQTNSRSIIPQSNLAYDLGSTSFYWNNAYINNLFATNATLGSVNLNKTTIVATTTDYALSVTQHGTGDVINLFDGATEVFTVIDGGNVGIGTTAPVGRLHSFATTEQLRLGYNATNYASFTVGSTGKLTVQPTGTDADVEIRTTNFDNAISIDDSAQRVGIGTDAPLGGALYVQGDITLAGSAGVGGATSRTIGLWGGANALILGDSNDDVRIGKTTAGTNFLYYDNSANAIGINTETPGAFALDVNGSQRITGMLTVNTGTAGTQISTLSGSLYAGSNALQLLGSASNGLWLGTAADTPVLAVKSGNVGIGTTNPAYKLHVEGTSSLGNQATAGYFTATTTTDSVFPRFTFTNATGTSATTTNLFSTNATFTNTTLTNANITDLLFTRATGTSATTTNFYNSTATNLSNSLYINSSGGNVGVGTTNPGVKFQVHSTAAASSAEVGFKHTVSDVSGYIEIGNGDATDTRYGPQFTNYITGNAFTKTNFLSMIDGANDTGSEPVLYLTSRTTSGALSNRPVLAVFNHSTELLRVGANGNVGIGTTNPGATLDVVGNIKLSATGNQLRDFNGNNLISNSAGTVTVGSTAVNVGMVLNVGTGGATVTIPNGNVGVGTTNPTYKLDVLSGTANTGTGGSGANPNVLLVTGANVGISSVGGNIFVATNDAQGVDKGGSIGFGGRKTDASTLDQGFATIKGAKENATSGNTAGYLSFATFNHNVGAQAERMRIDSAGNVGIGTTNPLSLLSLSKAIGSTTVGGGIGARIETANGLNTRSELGFSYAGNPGTYTPVVIGYKNTSNTGYTLGDFYVATRNATTDDAPTERFTVTAAGRVGIGSTNPTTAALEVNGSGYFAEGLSAGHTTVTTGVVNANTGFRIANAAASNNVLRGNGTNFVSSASAALTKSDDTNVTLTLGGTPATALLDAVSLTLGWSGQLSVPRGGTGASTFTTNGVLYGNGVDAVQSTAQGGANTILTANNGAPAWSSTPSIGTSLTTPLIIGGTAADSSLSLRSTSGAGTTDHIKFQVGNNGATEAMRITTLGNVGIGSTAPNTKFVVDKATSTTNVGEAVIAKFQGANAANARTEIGLSYYSASGSYSPVVMGYQSTSHTDHTKGNFYIATRDATTDSAPTERLTILPGGNIGIGTTNPTVPFHVSTSAATTDYVARIVNTQGTRPLGLLINTNTQSGTNSDAVLHVQAGGNSRLKVEAGGNVGIGTASPNSLLHVAGGSGLMAEFIGSTPNVRIQHSGNSRFLDIEVDANAAHFEINDSKSLTLLNGGNVGIGTTNPAVGLHTVGKQTRFQFGTAGGGSGSDASGLYQFIDYGTNQGAGSRTVSILAETASSGFALFEAKSGSATYSSATSRFLVRGDGNVGVGTTNPGSLLHVAGTGYFSGALTADGGITLNSGDVIRADDGTAALPSYTFGSDLNTGMWRPGVDTIGFSTAGTEKLRITAAGNVGIGTTTPATLLHAAGGYVRSEISSVPKFQLKRSGSAIANGNIEWLGSDDSVDAAISLNLLGGAGDDLNFAVGGTTIMTLNDGFVGIGTTTPFAKLHVSAGTSGVVIPIAAADDFIVEGSSSTQNGLSVLSPDSAYSYAAFGSPSDSMGAFLRWNYNNHLMEIGTADATADLRFLAGDTSEKLRITAAGNVGIGTTTPSTKLHIGSAVGSDSVIRLSDEDVAHGMSTLTDTNVFGSFQPASSSGGGLQIRGFSDVGSVQGFVLDGIIGSNDPTDSVPAILLRGSKKDTGTSWAALGSSETVFQVQNNTTSLLTLLGSGNVGIGTTAPLYKFDVQGTTNTVAMRALSNTSNDILYYGTGTVTGNLNLLGSAIDATGNVVATIANSNVSTGSAYTNVQVPAASTGDPYYLLTTSGATNWSIGIDNSEDDKLKIGATGNPSSGTPAMTITTAGSVGIGSTAPGTPLDVNGAVRATLAGGFALSGTAGSTQGMFGSGTGTFIRASGTGDIGLQSSTGASHLYITGSNGNVGIGTTSPSTLLSLSSTAPVFRIANTTGVHGVFDINVGNTDVDLGMVTALNENLHLLTDNTRRLTIAGSTGNVGIGTTNPGNRLHVETTTTGTTPFKVTENTGTSGSVSANFDSSSNPFLTLTQKAANEVGYFQLVDSSGNRWMRLGKTFAGGVNWSASTSIQIAIDSNNLGSGAFEVAKGSVNGRAGTDGTSLFYIANGGNVGIGTTNPGDKLQVVGGGITLDDNQNLQWGDTGTAIDGSASSDFLRFFTGGTEKMRLNDSGYLGIGTSSPTSLLHVARSGAGVVANFRDYTDGGATGQGLNIHVNEQADGTDVDNLLTLSSTGAATGAMAFGTGATERMRITTDGFVGIGTTTPSTNLNIFDATINSKDVFSLKSGADSIGDYLGLNFTTGVGGAGPHAAIRTINGPSANDARIGLFTTTDGSTLTEKFSVDHVGNVGIGTTNPGTLQGGYATGGKVLQLTDTTGSDANLILSANGTRWPRLWFENADATVGKRAMDVSYVGNTLSFTSRNESSGAAVVSNILNIHNDGNVGIGFTNPSQKIAVQGTANDYTGGFFAHNTTGQAYGLLIDAGTNTSDYAMRVRNVTGASEYFAIRGDGNVGIGSATPGYKLDVQGTISAGTAVAGGTVRIEGKGGTSFPWLLSTSDVAGLTFDSNTLKVLTLLDSGNVGIGTTTPWKNFSVAGTVAMPGLETSTDNSDYALVIKKTDGTIITDSTLLYNPGGDTFSVGSVNPVVIAAGSIRASNTSNLTLSVANFNPTITISGTTGYVGVGSTTPFAQLAVENTGSGLSFAVNDAANDVSPFVVDASGNVGVGTTAPTAGLHIANGVFGPADTSGSAADQMLRINQPVTSSLTLDVGLGTVGSVYSWLQSRDALNYADNYALSLNPNGGNVGIGTTNPGDKLEVKNGGIIIDRALAGEGQHLVLRAGGTSSYFLESVSGTFQINDRTGAGAQPFKSLNGVTNTLVLNNGKVGIGTTTPGQKFVIAGPNTNYAHFDVATNDSVLRLNSNTIDNYSGLDLTYGAGSSQRWRIGYFGGTVNSNLDFTNSGGTRMSIDTNGNVGIGTTSPNALLHLNGAQGMALFSNTTTGSATTDGTIIGHDTGENVFTFNNREGGTNAFRFMTGSTNLLHILSSGNVGIGSTTPLYKLSVEGTSSLGNQAIAGYLTATSTTATSTFAGFIDVNGTGTNATSTFASNLWVKGALQVGTGSLFLDTNSITASNGGFRLSSVATSTFATNGLTVGTSQFVVQQTSGNVGIGTTNPDSKLDVVTTSNASFPLLVRGDIDNAGGYTGIGFGYEGTGLNYQKASIMVKGTSGSVQPEMHFLLDNTVDSSNATIADAKLSILPTGNVGIGISDPNSRFMVKSGATGATGIGNARANAAAFFEGNSSSTWGLAFGNTNTSENNYIQSMDRGQTTGRSLALNPYGGSVGIGTVSPSAKLQVTGDLRVVGTDYISYFAGSGANEDTVIRPGKSGGAVIMDVGTTQITQLLVTSTNGITNSSVGVVASGAALCYNTGSGQFGACSSDERLKTNISTIGGSALGVIQNLRAVNYAWKDAPNVMQTGFIAQEVAGVIPSAVYTTHNEYLGFKTDQIVPFLVKGIQELNERTITFERDASDTEAEKQNTSDFEGGLALINSLKTKAYNLIGSEIEYHGFVVEDVASTTPSAIIEKADGTKIVDYLAFIPALVQSVQDLYAQLVEIKDTMLAWADRFVSRELVALERVCIGETCINESQLIQLLQNSGMTASAMTQSPSSGSTSTTTSSTSTSTSSTTTSTSTPETTTTTTSTSTPTTTSSSTPSTTETVTEPAPTETTTTEPAPTETTTTETTSTSTEPTV